MRTTTTIKRITILTITIIAFLSGNAQDTITIAETTFKIKGGHEESFFYGFAEGDKMVVSMEEIQGKAIKEFEIIESPSSSKFMDINTAHITKSMFVPRTAVYEFRVKAAAMAPRTCRIKVFRIPKDESSVNFNTAGSGRPFTTPPTFLTLKILLLDTTPYIIRKLLQN